MKFSFPSGLSRRHFLARSLLALLCWLMLGSLFAQAETSGEKHWYKGNTHCHSFWSDGTEFPEIVVDSYKRMGYDFLVSSDHNTLQRGEKWINVKKKDGKVRVSDAAIEHCRQRFGEDAVQIRERGGIREVKLKTIDETRRLLEEPDNFLLIEGEEITGSRVHLNALNISETFQPEKEENIAEWMGKNIRNVNDYAEKSGRSVVAHVNHPNWSGYRVSAANLAAAAEARFFEVCNCIPNGNHAGNDKHPGVEKLWDIANTLRIVHWKTPPLFGIASDDAHTNVPLDATSANPGRGWVVVRAAKLDTEELMKAMQAGDFYASTGVALADYRCDPNTGVIRVRVRETPGVQYRIDFVGTLRDAVSPENLAEVADGNMEVMELPEYAQVGEVLKTVDGPEADYRFTGKEIYVRAVVHSTKKLSNPPKKSGRIVEEAWCQPIVGK
jgi:hypothetical protein